MITYVATRSLLEVVVKRQIALTLLICCAAVGMVMTCQTEPDQSTPKMQKVCSKGVIYEEVAQIATVPVQMTDDEILSISNRLETDVAQLCVDYPLAGIREQFMVLCQEFDQETIRLIAVASRKATGGFASIMRDTSGRLEIRIYIPELESFYESHIDEQESQDDELVAFLLHERYHLIEQGVGLPHETDPAGIVEVERAAWWYCVEELYLPMRNAGRLQGLHPHSIVRLAFIAHEKSQGDMYSPNWTHFARLSTGIPDSVLDEYGAAQP